jgi:hypothetical protein
LWIGRKKINIGRKKASSRYGKIFSWYLYFNWSFAR